ncbi:MAG: hypothetical protein DRJ52_00175 [Thermoprotei archaeon]|nr:MAG: hypothetical protein DRJ52_00175 [Thermoprotei archaeon]
MINMPRPKDLRFYQERLDLFYRLKFSECTVRWHAYEYLILCRDFICVILLEPWKSKASLYFRGNTSKVEKLASILEEYSLKDIEIVKLA